MIFRSLFKDSAIYGGADFLTKILSFFAFPVIAAALSPKAFGALELIFTITALTGLVLNCGLNNSVQRFYWDSDTSPQMRPKVVSSGYLSMIAFGFIALMIGLCTLPILNTIIKQADWPLSWIALLAALVVMVLTQWTQYALDVTRLHFAPWRFMVLALTSRVMVMMLGVIAVVVMDWGVDGLLVAQALGLILVFPLAIWIIRRDFQFSQWDRQWAKELVRFGYPFIYAGLAYWLFGSMDRWMLASMTSVEEVGIYSVAFRFASVVLFVSAAFGQAWSPVAIKIRADHPNHYQSIYGQVLLLLLFVMLTVGGGIALFAGEGIALIMPTEYQSSALPLAILSFGIIMQSTQQVTAIGISLEKKTYLFARLAWFVAGVNFIGNWLLIPKYGSTGAAWATVISYVVLTSSYFYYTQRLHPIKIEWNKLIGILLLGCFIAILAVNFVSNDFVADIVIFKVAFASLCLLVGWRLLPIHSFKGI